MNRNAPTANRGETVVRTTSDNVQVYLRVRPLLLPDEKDHETIEFKKKDGRSSKIFEVRTPKTPSAACKPLSNSRNAPATVAVPPPLRNRQNVQWKRFEGFTDIFGHESTNELVYKESLERVVRFLAKDNEAQGKQPNSCCVFTYGHTGSGKSHTLLGYDDKDQGVYQFAARDLLSNLRMIDPNIALLVRVTELYMGTIRDLLASSPEGSECTIRQDGKGVVHVRGPMKTDEKDGRIHQQPLGRLCCSVEAVVECVQGACAHRRVGTSTHHDQSSRSHLILEMEIVTQQLLDERQLFVQQEAELTRLKWLQTERIFGKHLNRTMPAWTKVYITGNQPSKLRNDIRKYESLVTETQQRVEALLEKQCALGGNVVFCDLAGNEYARDAAGSTKEQAQEAAAINKSLLAVKEMLRHLQDKSSNVPYRDSKLTMVLRRHLDNSSKDDKNRSMAIMLAHISPSCESFRKTTNTLNYCSVGSPLERAAIKKTPVGK